MELKKQINVVVRPCALEEMGIFFQMADLAGKNFGLTDPSVYHQLDPNGFFIALDENNLVGTVSAIKYNDEYGFIGSHLIHPELQGSQLAQSLLEVAMNRLQNCTVALNCYESQLSFYQANDFKPSHSIFVYSGKAQSILGMPDSVVSPFLHPVELVYNLDRTVYNFNRKHFLYVWLNQTGSMLLANLEDGHYTAMGIYRPCKNSYEISEMISLSIEAAEKVLDALLWHIPQGMMVNIAIPASNTDYINLIEARGFEKTGEYIRMYKPAISVINEKNVVATGSFDVF
ncbi:MAG: GNAT family N-acetyltransferase [Ignavibacteria bacterium]|nr:GNAT family N-acetyltransferase [Ignavibacteria bacterium]